MNLRSFSILGVITLAGCVAASAGERGLPSDADLLHTAMHQLSDVIVYDIFSPPQASRAYAYASVAAYEALRPSHPEYRSLAGRLVGLTTVPAPPPGAELSFPLASVHAFMTVGRALTFSRARMDSLRLVMDDQFRHRKDMSKDVFDRSIAYGELVATHVLTWSRTDHYLQTRGMPKYTVTRTSGRWIPTPPAYMDAVEPNWARIRPFVMDSASQYRALPPIPFDTSRSSRYFREVTEVYNVVHNLTAEQRAVTSFWDCNPYVMHVQGHAMFATKKITPGGHWMGIVAIASRKAHADMMKSAEAYARTAVALADGFISSWDMKFSTNMIRPETVINKYVDESWEPVLQTPPFPEYTSGHSVISTAAAQILTSQFGRNFSFVDSTEMEFGLPARSFTSFEQAAAEAAISRLYGGIHYRSSIEQGAVQGRRVGQLVAQRIPAQKEPSPVATAPVRSTATPASY
jgi:hypothetical protein